MDPLRRAKLKVRSPYHGAGSPDPVTHLQLLGEVGLTGPAVSKGQIQVQAVVWSAVQLAVGIQQAPILTPSVFPTDQKDLEQESGMSAAREAQAHSFFPPPCPSPGHQDCHHSRRGVPASIPAPAHSPPFLHVAARMPFKKKMQARPYALLTALCLPLYLKGKLVSLAWPVGLR